MRRPTKAELIEAGAALQREAHGENANIGALTDELFAEAELNVTCWAHCQECGHYRADEMNYWQHVAAMAAQLAAEKAGMA